MSSIYRQLGHLGKKPQEEVKKIIKKYYDNILKHGKWDYNFIHKTTTITDIHKLLDKTVGKKNLPSLQSLSLERILSALRSLQSIRKNMVALHHERIPRFQWVLLYFLAAVLLITLSVIPSQGVLYSSVIKGIFASSIIFVFILLRKFDRLEFFEKTIGEESAQDVLDIFVGKK